MNELLSRMSDRERRLFAAAGSLVLALAAYLVGSPAVAYLYDLDEQIADKEFQLVQYSEHAARADAVDEAYREIAKEHGSQMTQQAIHDSLRTELLRLAIREMPPAGNAVPDARPQDRLVVYRDLPEGRLETGLEGYREYTIEFRTLPGDAASHIEFLKRIQESPMSLRIKRLELDRQPMQKNTMAAVIELARIVVDGVAMEDAAAADPPSTARSTVENPSFEQFDEAAGQFAGWIVESGEAALDAELVTDGERCARLSGGAAIYQPMVFTAGRVYQCSIDLNTEGEMYLGIANENGEFIGEPIVVSPTEQPSRFRFAFTAPEGVVHAPYIVQRDEASIAFIDNVQLKPALENN